MSKEEGVEAELVFLSQRDVWWFLHCTGAGKITVNQTTLTGMLTETDKKTACKMFGAVELVRRACEEPQGL